jgi:CheY-like chemotaxis protein
MSTTPRRTLLLVEDDPDDLEMTMHALRRCGYIDDIVVMRDGREAEDYLFAQGDFAGCDVSLRPAVLLLDLGLPRVSGFDLLARACADPRTFRMPVIVLTGSKDPRQIDKAYELGASSYILKTSDPDELARTLGKVIQYWLELNVPPVQRGLGSASAEAKRDASAFPAAASTAPPKDHLGGRR